MPTHTSFVRFVSCTLVAAVTIFSPFGSLLAHANEAGVPTNPIVIGEVAWAGSSLSTADEWIELWNLGDEPASLAGWSLAGAGEGGKTIAFPATSTIPAHGVYLVSNYAASDAKSALDAPVDVVTTTVSLSNSALMIDLIDGNGTLVDSAGTGGTPPAGASLPIKTSMIRDATGGLSSTSGWINATSSYGMKPDLPDLGTPGLCDGCVSIDEPADEPTPQPEPEPVQAATTTEPIPSATSAEPAPTSTVSTVTSTDITSPDPSDDVAATETEPTADATTTEMPDEQTDASTSTEMETVPEAQEDAADPVEQDEPPTPPNYAMLHLNEIMANPSSGKEWVEIVSLDATNRIPLDGCELHDATGRILTITNRMIDPATSTRVVVELSSARLNNSGDSISLYDPSGQMLDAMTYGNTTKGDPWIRSPDKTGSWQPSTVPTPNAENFLPPVEPEPTVQAATLPIAQPPIVVPSPAPPKAVGVPAKPVVIKAPAPKTTKQTSPPSASREPTRSVASTPVKLSVSKAAKKTATTKTSAAPTKPKAKPKAKAASVKAPAIIPLSFDMRTSDEYGNLRVQLQGTVGTQPGLLTSHAFVLQSPDGRGLLVSVPTSHKLPPIGISVSVVGTLRFDNNNIPSLKLGAKDGWIALPTELNSAVVTRVVDLTSPSAEDAWSLIQLTGTVVSVKGQTVHLDLADAEIDLFIRPIVDYRAKRLLPGDVVNVKGILDTTRDAPRLLPRTADEIVLVRHAEVKTAAQLASKQSLPPWTPLGAAAGAVAATEGVKHLHRRKRQKDLEKKLTTLTAATVIQDW